MKLKLIIICTLVTWMLFGEILFANNNNLEYARLIKFKGISGKRMNEWKNDLLYCDLEEWANVNEPVGKERILSENPELFLEMSKYASFDDEDNETVIPHEGTMEGVDITDFSFNKIGLLTIDQLNTMSKNQFVSISKAQLSALNSNQIAGLNSPNAYYLAYYHIEDLTVEQLNAIGHERLQFIPISRFSNEQLAGLFHQQLNCLCDKQFDNMTNEQLSTFTPERIGDLDKTRSYYLASRRGGYLTVDQLNAIGHGQIGNVDMRSLTPEQVIGLSVQQLNNLRDNQFDVIDGNQLSTFTPERIGDLDEKRSYYLASRRGGNLTVDQLNAIGHGQIGNVDMRSLTPEQVVGLSVKQLNNLRDKQFDVIDGEQLSTFTPERVGDLDKTRSYYLASRQGGNLTVDQLNAIGHGQIENVDMRSLTPEQVIGLSVQQLNNLRDKQFDVIDGEQLSTFTPERVGDLDETRSYYLASRQGRNLTVDQLNSIRYEQIRNIDMNRMSEKQILGLSVDRLGEMTSSQLNSVSPDIVNKMSPEQKVFFK